MDEGIQNPGQRDLKTSLTFEERLPSLLILIELIVGGYAISVYHQLGKMYIRKRIENTSSSRDQKEKSSFILLRRCSVASGKNIHSELGERGAKFGVN